MGERLSAQRTLLLLDVDGVLVHPLGYRDALRATVDHFAGRMGQTVVDITDDEIAVFEACGITNEWDSGAICVSALLLAVLGQQPELRRDTLDATLAAARTAARPVPRPDFVALARDILAHNHDGGVPSALHLERLAGRIDPAFLPLVSALLRDVYDIITPTTRVFQTHTLGGEHFAATYGRPAPFTSTSFLAARDQPLLSPANRDRLLAWARDPGQGVAVFTARPSLPPADLNGPPPQGFPPEGELAVELVGLDGQVPLIGQGRVKWLADQYGRPVSDYIKPSPVQALAAIAAAASGTECAALESAAALAERGELAGPLAALAGGPVRVVVFEDAVGGIRATERAGETLRRAGLDVTVEGIGVSPNADKRAALAGVAVRVVDTLDEGLAPIIGG